MQRVVLPRVLPEVSGGIATDTCFWWLNDGGNPAVLWATDFDGNLMDSMDIGDGQTDWEALEKDSNGRLYIGDFGNNLNRRRDLKIIRFSPQTQHSDTIHFRYSDQLAFPPPPGNWQYDCEAMVVEAERIFLWTKPRLDGKYQTFHHYELPNRPGHHVAELIGKTTLKRAVPTDAFREGNELTLLTYHYRYFLGFFPLSRADLVTFSLSGNGRIESILDRRKIRSFPYVPLYETIFRKDGQWIIAAENTPLKREKFMRLKK